VTLVYAGNSAVDCNSYWAQGGIIYRGRPEEDSAELLASDIHRAGAGLCDDAAVTKVAVEGPGRVEQLLLDYAKVPFDRVASGELSLCLEASHTAPRILHTADHTGKWITQSLAAAVARHPLITQCPHSVVVDLLTALDGATDEPACVGLTTLDRRTGKLTNLHASSGVLLASGGLAGIYQHSTNPAGFNALGSSVALARRAGAETRDLEFVQFHPTSLYIPQQPRFLLTEALRGEGGILRDSKGRAFARDYHEDGELAPRDVVARAVFSESQNGQVYLDITHRDATWLSSRFPSVQEYIKKYQLDLSKDWLPVIPAAHYTCGGIATDLSGRTSLRGLFAAGEAARTGLHGGNRLASTSLLEGLVFGSTVGDFCGTQGRNAMSAVVETSVSSSAVSRRRPPLHVEPAHIESAAHRAMQVLRKIRRTMWDQVGVERNQSGLASALESLRTFQKQAGHLYATCPTLETAAVRDAAHAGVAVAEAALANPVSAGAHYLVEEPALSPMGAHADDSDEDEGAVAAAR
jgi:L-aspartate oxidase